MMAALARRALQRDLDALGGDQVASLRQQYVAARLAQNPDFHAWLRSHDAGLL
jgi:hypothetical protein